MHLHVYIIYNITHQTRGKQGNEFAEEEEVVFTEDDDEFATAVAEHKGDLVSIFKVLLDIYNKMYMCIYIYMYVYIYIYIHIYIHIHL